MPRQIQNNRTDVLKFVHITDTHLLDRAEETLHGLNTKKSLETVLSYSQTRYPDIDFLLFTGDISQTGSDESYRLFKSVIQQCDLPIYCIPGNHDSPESLQRIIPGCPDKSINIVQLGEFSLVLLNSWVEDRHHGLITRHCLQQLDDHLKNCGNQYNIIAIHHPPVRINSRWLDELGLQNQADFLQIMNRYSQNSLLICGHVHQEVERQLNQMRLLATPSTCHQFKVNADSRHHIDTPAPAFRFVRLTAANHIETKVHYIE